MSQLDSSDSYLEESDAPPQVRKTNSGKKVNLKLKQKIDKELQNKYKKASKGRKGGLNWLKDRSRSRSRDRVKKMKMEIRQREDKIEKQGDIIVISDDQIENQSSNAFNKFKRLQSSIYRSSQYFKQEDDGLNWRERQKIDRAMERGMRYFKEGKPRDQLSFQVFNTIEAYFK